MRDIVILQGKSLEDVLQAMESIQHRVRERGESLTVRVTVDDGTFKIKVGEGVWSPPRGNRDPGCEMAVTPDHSGPWFEVGDRVTHRGFMDGNYTRQGLDVVATVVETMPIIGSNPARQQFRAEGADWCGSGSVWNHSDSFEVVANEPQARR